MIAGPTQACAQNVIRLPSRYLFVPDVVKIMDQDLFDFFRSEHHFEEEYILVLQVVDERLTRIQVRPCRKPVRRFLSPDVQQLPGFLNVFSAVNTWKQAITPRVYVSNDFLNTKFRHQTNLLRT